MDVLAGFKLATSEATQLASGMQEALAQVGTLSDTLSSSLLFAGTSVSSLDAATMTDTAKQTLESMVSVLNTRVAGRSLFAGAATDRAPMPSADDLISALKTAVSGAITPDDIIAAATDWFDDPAGFAAVSYGGAPQSIAPLALSDTENLSIDVRADNKELRDLLRNAAVSALATDPSFGLSLLDQSELFGKNGANMLGSNEQLIHLRARVGFAEARIEQVATRNNAKLTSLESAKGELLGVDAYDTATKLESVQFQLQSLYAVTVRMSQLSLVNYL
ncbi:flagellin [Sulfitobacter sp. SK012]|uniref:flagellin n=1 Tax=Sulfitobacter sp. SK012 TaxID=1389005 RepID=UPI0020C7A3E7|nr:flagellin [Sulfitobacter sp. SK012]